jgi:HK97 family phage portal protein
MDRVGRAILGRKDSAVGPMVAMRRVGQPVWSSRNYRAFAKEGYSQNVVAYRCIRMIAESAAAVKLLAYEGDAELSEHPFLKVLSRPNPWQSGPELVDALISYFKLAGDGFLEAVELDGDIRELYALRPDRMKAIAGRRGYPMAWEYSVDGTTKHRFDVDLLPDQQMPILHIKEFHPLDDWSGMSPVEAAAFAIDVHNAAGGYNKALLDNSAAPSGALVFEGGEDSDGALSDDQFARLKTQFSEKHTGPQNAGKPLILEGGLKWQAMGMSPKDLEFVSGKREAAREIALAFGVPPMLLGIPGDNTYSNYQEARAALYEETVLPLVDKVCEALSNWVQPTYEGLRIGYDVDAIEALSPRRSAIWDRVQKADFITTDEKREAVGYGPYKPTDTPGGTILVGGAMMPLEETGFTPGGPAPVDPNAGA